MIMKHYITPDNKLYGFDESQANLIPSDAVEIPSDISFDKYQFLSLIKGEVFYDKEKHEAKIADFENRLKAENDAKASALAKLAALGLTQDEIKALLKQ